MSDVVQVLLSGLVLSAIYALVAIGWSLIWSVGRVLNLMQGEYVVAGGLSFAWLTREYGWPWPLAVCGAVLAAIGLGIATDMLIRSLKVADVRTVLIVTLAMVLALQEGMAFVFGRDTYIAAQIVTGHQSFAGAILTNQALLLIGLAAATLVLLSVLLRRTSFGLALRACAESTDGARWCGISPTRMRTAAIALSSGLGALAGVAAVPLMAMDYRSGIGIGILGLIAAIAGGLGRISGALVGGLFIGMGEAMVSGFASSQLSGVFVYGVLLLLLLLAPTGLTAGVQRLWSHGRAAFTSTAHVRA